MCIRDRNSRESNKLKENKDDKVSSGENYDNRIKNMVLENNGVNIDSDNEISRRVEYNDGMLMCANESEGKWRESIEVEGLQRVNFPQVYCEPRCSQMLLFKGKSPLLLEDMRSLSCSLNFYELVPSVWDDRETVIWCYGERCLERELCVEREIEIFKVNRNYGEFVERLRVEMVYNYNEFYLALKLR